MSANSGDLSRNTEKGSYEKTAYPPKIKIEEAVSEQEIQRTFIDQIIAKMLDAGVKARGIEQVPENQRESNCNSFC